MLEARVFDTMTGLSFLFRVTLRRHDLDAEIFHLKEPQKIPQVMSQDEAKRLLSMADTLRNHLLLSLGYGAGLRVGEVVRLKVKHIDREQTIIHVQQSKGRKDRLVMLSLSCSPSPGTPTASSRRSRRRCPREAS